MLAKIYSIYDDDYDDDDKDDDDGEVERTLGFCQAISVPNSALSHYLAISLL